MAVSKTCKKTVGGVSKREQPEINGGNYFLNVFKQLQIIRKTNKFL